MRSVMLCQWKERIGWKIGSDITKLRSFNDSASKKVLGVPRTV